MKVTLAENSGFCFGVKKALEEVHRLKDEKTYILGKLIHNEQVVEKLKQKGINFIDDIDDIDSGTIVISAHGIPDSLIEKAKNKGLKIVDTTCPIVKNIHEKTKKLENEGYNIIIFGDKKHTEVRGIIGNLKNAVIIDGLSKINIIDNSKKYALVSQTTQDIEKFNKVAEELKKRINDIIIENTVCSATKLRQKSSKELAKEVDLMIVIGGYHSANTKRLSQICNKIIETKHIETASELKKEWFKNKKHIGVTAGASTPDWIVEEVLNRIKNGF